MVTPFEVVHTARTAFKTGKTKCLRFREQQLRKLFLLLKENKFEIERCLRKDLKNRHVLSFNHELEILMKQLKTTIIQLRSWANVLNRVENRYFGITDNTTIIKEPYGVVLIVGAWSKPLSLCLTPLAGAIASGNCVIIKPSHVTSNISELIAELLPKYLSEECYHVMIGGVTLTEDLVRENFDYVFYSGTVNLGIALKHIPKIERPIRQEFIGKSPVYLDLSSDVVLATQSILFGKFSANSIDYLLCSKHSQEIFLELAEKEIRELRREQLWPQTYSEAHFWRLKYILTKSKVAIGGKYSTKRLFIEPTILRDVSPLDLIMKEEVFGPILPVLCVENIESAMAYLKGWERSQILHIFSTNQKIIDYLLENVPFHSACVNNVMLPQQAVKCNDIRENLYIEEFTRIKRITERDYTKLLHYVFFGKYHIIKMAIIRWKKSVDFLVTIRYFSLITVGILATILAKYIFRHAEKESTIRVVDEYVIK